MSKLGGGGRKARDSGKNEPYVQADQRHRKKK